MGMRVRLVSPSGGICPGDVGGDMSKGGMSKGGCLKGGCLDWGVLRLSWDGADWFISFYIHTPHSKLGRTHVPHYKVRLYVSNKSMKIN